MRSTREIALDGKLTENVMALDLSGKAVAALELLLHNEELQAAQEYANTVSIVRLGYNDHGPVHMRTVAMNVLIMLRLLRQAGIQTSLEKDGCGDFEDSVTASLCAAILHDLGMGVGRQDHEIHSVYLALPILNRILAEIHNGNLQKQAMLRALTLECIAGHMGARTIHSIEAGVVQIADGCDMTKGRARIPLAIGQAKVGHIHQYSANSIEEVHIDAGKEKPIRIDINMSNDAGFFQVEEVLLKKIAGSTAKPFIELYAQVREEQPHQYL
ncbi:MAG: HD domain-containing protein [Treponema sp.]|jgi:metal-dependent HD superfamily phosphatase/phosphodiesterase|nr:HD domain-containing protein [Treponema sp.]